MQQMKICEHCKGEFYRSGRPHQRFCSNKCSHEFKVRDRPTSRRCENCPTVFPLDPRQKNKRFCSAHCVGLWREREKRLKLPPAPPAPRIPRKPGRIEWSIFGGHRGRGMAPTPRQVEQPAQPPAPAVDRGPAAWVQLLSKSGYR